MTPLALSALTDVILAGELLFLAGLSFRTDVATGSAAWFWAIALFLLGLSTMLGAIDHGFFESIQHPGHWIMAVVTRVTAALASFAMLVSTVRQFLSGRWGSILIGLGLLGLIATVWALAVSDAFLALMAYYSLILLLTLGFHLAGLRNGSGSVAMIVGIVGILGASAVVPLGGDGIPGLGLFATYHVLAMPPVLFLYLGGRKLKRDVPPSRHA